MGNELFAIETFQIDTYTESNIHMKDKQPQNWNYNFYCDQFENILIHYDYDNCTRSRLQPDLVWLRPAALAAAFGLKWDVLMNPYSESLCMLT